MPVLEDADGRHRGVEAVIDKDLASSLLARDLDADLLVLATDVEAVYHDFGTPEQKAIAHATPAGLRAGNYASGSMGPKVEAACRFAERSGARAAIGSLDQLQGLLDGDAGTQVQAGGPEIEYASASPSAVSGSRVSGS